MSIQNTIDQLQGLHRTIEGVKYAPSVYPGSINSAQLPFVIVWPGVATTLPVVARAQVRRMNREYSVRVFVQSLGQGDYDTPPKDGIELLNRFLSTYFSNTTLSDGYTQIDTVRDSGIVSGTAALVGTSSLLYSGNFYKGFVLTVNVIELMGA